MDFLASFGLGGNEAAPVEDDKYESVEALALHLRGLLEDKTTPTKAEHVATVLEMRSTAQFHVSLSNTENEAFAKSTGTDPTMGGRSSASTSVDPAGQTVRTISANDTLRNQSDNPFLQRTIAKHIVDVLGATDHSQWILRDLSRGQHGWSFTYICKDSLQQWTRENPKSKSSAVIGEYSQKDPDDILANRPAFDCRGSITISFNRNIRSITIKYDHTLLHKTVQQLSDEYQPPIREPGMGWQRQQELKNQQKTPKTTKSVDKEGRKRKSRGENFADRERAEGEGGGDGERHPKRKKKPRKKKPDSNVPDGPAMPPGVPGTELADGSSSSHATAHTMATASTIAFSVSPEEAARRVQVARTLLSEAGVDPDSLSVDQMNIFSNQSPELQRDSVAMLAMYGAERLQIIHPSSKDKAASSTSLAQAVQTTASGPTTTNELVPDTAKSGRNRNPTAKAAADTGVTETPSKPEKKTGKSRVACLSCKSRRVKCPKERPACSECASHNQSCEYPPQTPRNRKKKNSEANVVEDDADEQDEAEEAEEDDAEEGEGEGEGESEVQRPQAVDTPIYAETHHHNAPHIDHPDAYQNNMSVADMLTPRTELQQSGNDPTYIQSSSGLVLPQPPVPQQTISYAAGTSGLALPQPAPQHTQPPVTSTRKKRNSTAASRQSDARVSTASPQISDSLSQPPNNVQQTRQKLPQAQQSPRTFADMQGLARNSPLQTGSHPPNSSQRQRGQSRTPNQDQDAARGYQPPAQTNSNVAVSSSHSNVGGYPSGNNPMNSSTERIGYSPYSWQQKPDPTSESYPAFDYNRTTSTSISTSNPSIAAPSYPSGTSTSNAMYGSQSRASRPQDRNVGYDNRSSFQQNTSNPTSLRNIDMRGSAQKRPSSGAMSKPGYSQYGSQQPPGQQMDQVAWENLNYPGGNQFGSDWM